MHYTKGKARHLVAIRSLELIQIKRVIIHCFLRENNNFTSLNAKILLSYIFVCV